jgi:hypothetical protein
MDSVPPSALRSSAEVRRMLCISRRMLPAREMISSPAAVVRVSARPSRSNSWNPSSSSSKLQLPAHAGLRGVQLACGGRDVEPVLVNRHEVAQLLELHVS